MADPKSLATPIIDAVLQSSWGTALLLPLGYGVFRLFEYLLKRKVEGKPQDEKIDQYHKLIDLKEKLDKHGMTIAGLNDLRAQALGEAAGSLITVVERLVSDYETTRDDNLSALAGPEGDLNQYELNVLSSQKAAQTDDELAAVIEIKLRAMGQDASEALMDSQAAWEAFRKMETVRESQRWEGGSIRPLMANSRFEALTRQRIATLSTEDQIEETEIVVVPPRTPGNLFNRIELSVPSEKVRGWLGTPNYQYGNRCSYRYEETQVEISFDANNGVKELVVALLHGQTYSGVSPAYAVSIPLGQMTLQDVLSVDGQLHVEYFRSLRTEEVFVRGRMGPSGAWTPFSFGALKIFSGVGLLQESDFEWDAESGTLLTDPQDVLINWMAFGTDDVPSFSWFIK